MFIRPTAHPLLAKGACCAAWCGVSHLSNKLTLSISEEDNYMSCNADLAEIKTAARYLETHEQNLSISCKSLWSYI